MSPVKSVEDRALRPPVIGKIKLGVFRGGRPQATKTFVFTSPDAFYLGPLAKAYGGEPERYLPQGQTEEQWRLVTTTTEIVVLLPFSSEGLNWEQWRELYGSGHIKRRCDEETAEVYTVDEETGEVAMLPRPCVCASNQELECDLVTRLHCWIPSAGLGVWELVTRSKNAAFSIPGEFALLGSQFEGEVNKVPVALTLTPRKTTRWDATKHRRIPATVLTVSMRLAVPFLEAKASLAQGGNPALEAFGHRPALGAGETPREGSDGVDASASAVDGRPAPARPTVAAEHGEPPSPPPAAGAPEPEPNPNPSGAHSSGSATRPTTGRPKAAGNADPGNVERGDTGPNGEGATGHPAPDPSEGGAAGQEYDASKASSLQAPGSHEAGRVAASGGEPGSRNAREGDPRPPSDTHRFEGTELFCQRDGCACVEENPVHTGRKA